MIIRERRIKIRQELHTEADHLTDRIRDILKLPWLCTVTPGIELCQRRKADGLHAIQPFAATAGRTDLRGPENATQACRGEPGDVLGMTVGITIDDKRIPGSRTIAGAHQSIGADITGTEQVVVQNDLHDKTVGLSHGLTRQSGREGGVIRPQPVVVPINLIDLISADPDMGMIFPMLFGQQLPCCRQSIIRHDSEPHQVRT